MKTNTTRTVTTVHELTLTIEDLQDLAKKKGIKFERGAEIEWAMEHWTQLPSGSQPPRSVEYQKGLTHQQGVTFRMTVQETLDTAIKTGLEEAIKEKKKRRKLR